MSIQLITNDPDKKGLLIDSKNTLNAPKALDMFDINIIDLGYKRIWTSKSTGSFCVDCINDFYSIKEIVNASKKSTVVFILPQNKDFLTGYSHTHAGEQYIKNINLKINYIQFVSIVYLVSCLLTLILFCFTRTAKPLSIKQNIILHLYLQMFHHTTTSHWVFLQETKKVQLYQMAESFSLPLISLQTMIIFTRS